MKYYRVIKDNFLWEDGAILKQNSDNSGYVPVDDIFCKIEHTNEYISKDIIEKSPEYFEKVYKVDLLTKVVYETKDRAKELITRGYKDKK